MAKKILHLITLDLDGKRLTFVASAALLWTAPELLHHSVDEHCSKVDVYSFAIVVHEILYRNGPFNINDESTTPKGRLDDCPFARLFLNASLDSLTYPHFIYTEMDVR